MKASSDAKAEAGVDNWRSWVLREFPPATGELVLVADRDGLVADEALQAALAERGYVVVVYEDPFVFRAYYERDWQARLEQLGGTESLAVVWPVFGSELATLPPFDLVTRGRRVEISRSRLFPKLAPSSLNGLEARHLDELWAELQERDSGQMGPDSSRDLVLHRVFEIDLPSIRRAKNPASRLLSTLLRLHFRGNRLPVSLVERATLQLSGLPSIIRWPLAALLTERAAFLAFLQQEWVTWIEGIAEGRSGTLPRLDAPEIAPPPEPLPFWDRDVAAMMDTYFIHGLLTPVPLSSVARLPVVHRWATVGIVQDAKKDAAHRLEKLLAELEIPGEGSSWADWRSLAAGMAEACLLRHTADLPDDSRLMNLLASHQVTADDAFQGYLLGRYGGLASLPHFSGPVMVHHVSRYMADRLSSDAARVALLVLDGLALDQWALMQAVLPPMKCMVRVEQSPIFAWIPTLTSVSRQAIFSGLMPRDFGSNIFETGSESMWWRRFWDKKGVSSGQVRHLGLLKSQDGQKVAEIVEDTDIRVVGGVISIVDDLIHDFPLPRGELEPILLRWARKGWLTELIEVLLGGGFEVFVTADHGNVQARGIGAPPEGKLADLRGERARAYNSESLRDLARKQIPEGVEWPGYGLPGDFHVLLAPPGAAFVRKGESLICHGGASLLEVFVPFVHFRRGE